MRTAIATVVLALALPLGARAAHAEAFARPIVLDKQAHPVAQTTISHIVYMNNCMPDGCDLTGGDNDDAANHVSVYANPGGSHLSAYKYGDASWASLVDCAKLTYAPFDITVVDKRPTSGAYNEIIVAGTPTELNSSGQLDGAGGVAPLIGCGAHYDNMISYMFAGLTGDHNYLCGGVAQETSHVYGLSHELNPDDPLTYLNLGSHKTFQNTLTQCGEDLNQPHSCYCGGQQQNSYAYLMSNFGPFVLRDDATMTLTSPTDGAWLRPGFKINAEVSDQLPVASATLSFDATPFGTPKTAGPYRWDSPVLPAGDHTITVAATDMASPARNLMASVTVHIIGACDATGACPSGLSCLGGTCYPDSTVTGGLGATCTGAEQCLTGQCASDGSTSACTGKCDAGKVCPTGFTCLDDGGDGICWAGSTSSGGCNVGGASGSLVMLAGLGLVLNLRRRRRA